MFGDATASDRSPRGTAGPSPLHPASRRGTDRPSATPTCFITIRLTWVLTIRVPGCARLGRRASLRSSWLPRKEVIQPQLPLRLPCYDFVPITRPTLDGCLPEGLAHRLQVLPAFMT